MSIFNSPARAIPLLGGVQGSVSAHVWNPAFKGNGVLTHPCPSQEGNPAHGAFFKARGSAIPLLRGVQGCVCARDCEPLSFYHPIPLTK